MTIGQGYRDSIKEQVDESKMVSEQETKNDISELQDLTYENMALYFHYQPPIPFKPNKTNDVQVAIAATLKATNSKIPVVHIYKNLYLIGCNRLNCDNKFGHAFIKVGGGSQKMHDYLLKNEMGIQKQLIDLMVKHQL